MVISVSCAKTNFEIFTAAPHAQRPASHMRRFYQWNFFAHFSLRDRLNQPGLSGSLSFFVLLQNAGGAQISLLMGCLWKKWVSKRPENPMLHCHNTRCGAGLHGKRTESSVLIFFQVAFKIPHLLLVSRNVFSALKKMATAATNCQERTKRCGHALLLRGELRGRELLMNVRRKRLRKFSVPKGNGGRGSGKE